MSDVAGILIGIEPILNRLSIERFRGFRELTLTDGGQINLIVGRNDSGKTTLQVTSKSYSGKPLRQTITETVSRSL